ncbi:hypothetical protein APHAL10511_005908 [Amanita phalloides]|nr:hypothetical protein APHAL10511_005908 [Amanita phalloides]
MSPGLGEGADFGDHGAWAQDPNSRDSGWGQQATDQAAAGWGMPDTAWGTTGTNVSNAESNEDEHKVPERRASTSSAKSWDLPPATPREDLTGRSFAWEQNIPASSQFLVPRGGSRDASLAPTEQSSIISARAPRSADPIQVFKTTLKTLQQAVRRRTEYDQASAELDQWRRTRNSEEFSRATIATRRKLDEKRLEIGRRQAEAEKKLKSTLDGLAGLPDLSVPQLTSLQYVLNDAEMTRFHSEFTQWIQQASQHPVMQKEPELPPPPLPPPPEEPEKSATPETPFSKNPNEWTLDDVKHALAELENRVGVLSDQTYAEDHSSFRQETQSETHGRKELLLSSTGKRVEDLVARGEEWQQRIEGVLSGRAQSVAVLLQERADLKRALAYSRVQHDTLDTTLNKLTSLVEQIEKLQAQDEQDLVDLTALIQNLLVADRPPPQAKIAIDKLLPPLQHLIIPHLRKEVLPVIETFTSEFLQHDKKLQDAVKEMSDFIANKLDGIKINAHAIMNANKDQA